MAKLAGDFERCDSNVCTRGRTTLPTHYSRNDHIPPRGAQWVKNYRPEEGKQVHKM